MNVPFYRHNLNNYDSEILSRDVKSVIESMTLSTGNVCRTVESTISEILNVKHCLLTTNWTSATHTILKSLNIGAGDEVIVPSSTFIGTPNSVAFIGATPVFADIDPITKLVDFNSILDRITIRTKCVIVVHLYGRMVDVGLLRSKIPSHIRIIEDAAHAFESTFDGHSPATYSDAAMFSFYNSKNITCGEGGALVTNDTELYSISKMLYRHGVDMDGATRFNTSGYSEPQNMMVGFKANMTDIQASLLKLQITPKHLNNINQMRTSNAMNYINELSSLPIELPSLDYIGKHAWHAFAIGVNDRHIVGQKLLDNGIRTAIQFSACHDSIMYKTSKYFCPISSDWGSKTISLPVFAGMTESEQSYVIDVLRNIL